MTDYLLAGRYRLTDRIAAGGMGEVWRGEDELLNRAVAVKLLPTGRAGDEAFLARFRAEARYAASLSHPGIARVYDYGESAEFGGAYLIMELVRGEPLSAILARAGRLSPDATLDIVGQAARALDAAHQAGIVHRDIKPGNLLIAAGGTTKITDFGIATAVRAAQASHLTETGMVMGTAMYVSPEQATGAPVDASSDIYSLGVVAYECLAGHVPFRATEPLAIAYAHKHAPVPPAAARRAAARRRPGLRHAGQDPGPGGPPAPGSSPTGPTCCATRWLWAPPGARAATSPALTRAGSARRRPARCRGRRRMPDVDPGRGRRRPDRAGPTVAGWRLAGLTAVLCALAAAAGLYLSGHHQGHAARDWHQYRAASQLVGLGAFAQYRAAPRRRRPPSTVEPPSSSPSPTVDAGADQDLETDNITEINGESSSPTSTATGSGSPTSTTTTSRNRRRRLLQVGDRPLRYWQ